MPAPIYKRQEMLSAAHIAERWSLSIRKVYLMIESGELPAFKFGGCLRVHIGAVAEHEKKSKYDSSA